MAEIALKKLQDQLACPVCLDTYTDPKLLQCFHVYCQKCLMKLVVRDQQGLSLTCPICRQVTPIPTNGVAGLQPAFQTNHLLEIVNEHKKVSLIATDRPTSVESDSDFFQSFTPQSKVYCPEAEHSQKEMELYCMTCGMLICWKCAMKGGKHHSHDYEEINKALEKYKAEITASFNAIDEERKKATTDLPPSAEKISHSPPHSNVYMCHDHGGKEVELYCNTCEEPICWKCAIKVGKHHNHDYEELSKVFGEYKMEVTALLEPMEKKLTIIKTALAELDTCYGKISDQRAAIEATVHSTFRKIQEILDFRRTKIIAQLHQMTMGKLKNLAVQRDQMETTYAQLSSCLDFMRDSLETGSPVDVMMTRASLLKQVHELTTTFPPPDMLVPNTEADMIFSTSPRITAGCQNYGQISASGSLDPSKCHVTGASLDVAVVGETSTAVLQAVNFKDQPCKEPIQSSECELVSEITGTRTRGSIERRGQSQYEISYQPTIKGRHQLHIRVEGQHIRGSPFNVLVVLQKQPHKEQVVDLQDLQQIAGDIADKADEAHKELVARLEKTYEDVKAETGALSAIDKDLKFSFTIDSKRRNQMYSWDAAGLRLFLPDGPLPEKYDGKIIEVQTSAKGSFHFPSNARLVSSIYTITTDTSIDVSLEMEHCYRGDLQALAFGYCSSQRPPFHFQIAIKEQYKHSFTSTHGVIETKHFSHWVILWLKSSWDRIAHLFSQPSAPFPEDIVVFPYYQIQSTYIRVNLVLLKRLRAHIEVVENHYISRGWRCDTPMGICSARFDPSSSKVHVSLNPNWENIGSGWKLKPESPPVIERSKIEENEEFFCSINLLFQWKNPCCNSLDYQVTLEGLVIEDRPAYINLMIDRNSATLPAEVTRPNLENLRSFQGNHRTINIIEEIGTKYMDFGIALLDDRNGSYVGGLEKQLHANCVDINRKILTDWITGRSGAKPVEWRVLADTLEDIGLRQLAREIRETLNL